MPDSDHYHCMIVRLALLLFVAAAAVQPVEAAAETSAALGRSVLSRSSPPPEPVFIDDELDRQSQRSLEHADPGVVRSPAPRRGRHKAPWEASTVFEHLRKLRREQQSLPPHFRHSSLHGRHLGVGEPLEGTSWLNRPWQFSWFIGELFGDDLISGRVGQDAGIFGGYRIGYDFDHYWGAEGRFAFANLEITDSQIPPQIRTSRDWFWDAHILYYPWGDAKWRPYASLGLGLAHFQFVDELDQPVNTLLLEFPIGIGVKYQWKKWLVVRLDAVDNIAFGSGGMNTMNNFSLSAGLEWRFGGRRTSYWPYDPSIHLW